MTSQKQNYNQILAAIVLHAQDVLSESIDFIYGCSLIANAVNELDTPKPELEPFVKLHNATHHIKISADWKESVMTDEKQELQDYEDQNREKLWEACKVILKEYHH